MQTAGLLQTASPTPRDSVFLAAESFCQYYSSAKLLVSLPGCVVACCAAQCHAPLPLPPSRLSADFVLLACHCLTAKVEPTALVLLLANSALKRTHCLAK